MDITIAGAVIVRNEERCIKRCMDSLITMRAEIIFIDTGSVFNTLNILKSCPGDKLKRFNSKYEEGFFKSRIIRDHDSNISRSVRRGFIKSHDFYYLSYVHEELMNNNEILYSSIKIDIVRDGCFFINIEEKGKVNQSEILNLKNINI